MKKKFLVSFEIASHAYWLADLTAQLGVSPGPTSRERSVDARTGRTRPTVWKIESKAPEDASLEQHLESVLSSLDEADRLGLAKLRNDTDAYMSIGILAPGPMGSAIIPASYIKGMSLLSLDLEVVCYFCENDESNDEGD